MEAGASKVTTLEYGYVMSEHPDITTLTPSQFRDAYRDGVLPKFDGVVTFSSVEHSGLGRYGDDLNPWGDIIAIAQSWCVIKPKGFLVIGVPYGERDQLFWNAHRVYAGEGRYPFLTANWEQLWRQEPETDPKEYLRNFGVGICQRLHLFQKLGE